MRRNINIKNNTGNVNVHALGFSSGVSSPSEIPPIVEINTYDNSYEPLNM